jgi:hypothetical protein
VAFGKLSLDQPKDMGRMPRPYRHWVTNCTFKTSSELGTFASKPDRSPTKPEVCPSELGLCSSELETCSSELEVWGGKGDRSLVKGDRSPSELEAWGLEPEIFGKKSGLPKFLC